MLYQYDIVPVQQNKPIMTDHVYLPPNTLKLRTTLNMRKTRKGYDIWHHSESQQFYVRRHFFALKNHIIHLVYMGRPQTSKSYYAQTKLVKSMVAHM
jgi:hypothetical protein